MAENTEESVSVRVPAWVLDQIEQRIQATPRPRPSRGEVLTAAWEAYKRNSEENRANNSEDLKIVPESDKEYLDLSVLDPELRDLVRELIRLYSEPDTRRPARRDMILAALSDSYFDNTPNKSRKK